MMFSHFPFNDDFGRAARWKEPTPEEREKQKAEAREKATTDLLEEMNHRGDHRPREYMIAALAREGADLERVDKFWGTTALGIAACYNETGIVKALAKAGAKLDPVGKEGHTPFIVVCGFGYLDLVRWFIEQGTDVNQRTPKGETPLIYATTPGCRLETIQALVAAGAQIDAVDQSGKSAFDYCREGKDDYRRWGGTYNLFERKTEGGRSGREVYTELERVLLDEWFAQYRKQRKPALDRKWASTVLNAAVAQGDDKIARAMIAAGADPNMADVKGTPALLAAAQQGNIALIQRLVAAGGDIDKADAKGETPLAAALARDGGTEVVLAILAAGANPDIPDSSGVTPLVAVTKKGDLALMERLVAAGADINKPDKRGNTPLMAAVSPYNAAAMKFLMDRDADVEPRNASYETVQTLARSDFKWSRDIDGRPSNEVYAELKVQLEETAKRQTAEQFRTGLRAATQPGAKITLTKSTKAPPAPTALRLKKPDAPD